MLMPICFLYCPIKSSSHRSITLYTFSTFFTPLVNELIEHNFSAFRFLMTRRRIRSYLLYRIYKILTKIILLFPLTQNASGRSYGRRR